MLLNGVVSVTIDEVDIDQAKIELKDEVILNAPIFFIISAALTHPDMALLKRACDQHDHVLEYKGCEERREGKTVVGFWIRKKTNAEISA